MHRFGSLEAGVEGIPAVDFTVVIYADFTLITVAKVRC